MTNKAGRVPSGQALVSDHAGCAVDGPSGFDPSRKTALIEAPNAEAIERFFAELDDMEAAYPLSVFPEPDMDKAAALLQAGGMTLDAVSASNMRHVVATIAPKVRSILAMQSNG